MSDALRYIYVDRSRVASNKKNGRFDPPIKVKFRGKGHAAHRVVINGPVEFIANEMANPQAGGATVWAQTRASVTLINLKENPDGEEPVAEYTTLD